MFFKNSIVRLSLSQKVHHSFGVILDGEFLTVWRTSSFIVTGIRHSLSVSGAGSPSRKERGQPLTWDIRAICCLKTLTGGKDGKAIAYRI